MEEQHTLLQLAGFCCCCKDTPTPCCNSAPTTAAAGSSGSHTSHEVSNGNKLSSQSITRGDTPTAAAAAAAAAAGAVAAAAAGGGSQCACGAVLRSPPCSVVFADIGGNRQLESLVKLVPWVLRALKPRLLVVKSEELTAAAERQVAAEQQQQQQGTSHVTSMPVVATQPPAAAAAGAVVAAEESVTQVSSTGKCDSVIHDVGGWWQQLEQQCGNPASLAEPWFITARAAGFTKNPMRYPQRSAADGRRICRPYNYDRDRGCLKADSCPFDHQTCHHCLNAGHRAIDCPLH